ncbi:TPA: hypothetical protein EYO12_00505 [Candidatus Saccharibacteria bacterium]|nr:hypothetical protein [Candidatus Saccharibacteria bacterium]HIO87576.1 hypothetical protein [Candidatus Saccharibacteria bacterium]
MTSIDFFERRLDDKNRLTIPAEVRSEFDNGEVVLTRGFGPYLHMYTLQVWNEQVEPELKGAILDEKIADLNVIFRRGKVVTTMDSKQGRITLDQSLIDFATITRDVVAVRAGNYWRLMSPAVADAV